MRVDGTVRPRWVWTGLTASLAGAGLVGLGVTIWEVGPLAAGIVLFAAGVGAAVRGGVLYDTHGARPLRAELTEVRRSEVHEGTAPGDMVADPQVRRDAHETSRTVARIAAARTTAPRPGLVRACAVLLLLAAEFVLAAQGLYAHTLLGQDHATRDLGIVILIALAGLRLLGGIAQDASGRSLVSAAAWAFSRAWCSPDTTPRSVSSSRPWPGHWSWSRLLCPSIAQP